MIHDKICESRKVNAVDFYAEALWVRLLTKADDNGNYYRDVRRVHANCMLEKPKSSELATERALKSLLKVGLLKQYEADGREYVHLADFHEWQELRSDKGARIDHPVHPPNMGGAYIGEGLRRDTWVAQFQRESETHGEQEGNRSVPCTSPAGRPEVEVEGEVEVKEEVEVESPTTHSEDENPEEHQEGNFDVFRKVFREAAGVRVKPYTRDVEAYQAACRKHGEDEVLDLINDWVREEGGKAVTRKNKWAVKNFLDAVDELSDERKEPAPARAGEMHRLVVHD